jgi:hypothetical protein
MNSIYIFKHVPSSIKRLIYVYSIGFGTPTSKIIKEEYDKLLYDTLLYDTLLYDTLLYDTLLYNTIRNKHIDEKIGFMGCRISSQKYEFPKDPLKKYTELLSPPQIYEINNVKLFYLYTNEKLFYLYTNEEKLQILVYISNDIRDNNNCLRKLFKYKCFQLVADE